MTGRAVRVGQCNDCHAKILRGVDADTCGLPRALDHQPVDELGEALAVLTGRQTYDLRPLGGRSHGSAMEPRTAPRLRSQRHHPVHVEHLCGQPLPAAVIPDNAHAWSEEINF